MEIPFIYEFCDELISNKILLLSVTEICVVLNVVDTFIKAPLKEEFSVEKLAFILAVKLACAALTVESIDPA